MKQLLFLLLFPALALAQYQGNANQKITLGEQTTADGLVWRGRLADTANLLTNKLDTSVYIVLDTGTRAMWYYSASTTPKWTRLVDSLNNLQGQLSLTSKVTGVLPITNGGTGQTTLAAAGIITGSGTNNRFPVFSGSTTIQNSALYRQLSGGEDFIGINVSDPSNYSYLVIGGNFGGQYALVKGTKMFGYFASEASAGTGLADTTLSIGNFVRGADISIFTRPPVSGGVTNKLYIKNNGDIGIGTSSPAVQFHTTSNVRFAGLASITDLRTDADGDLFNGSDFNLKNSIDTINFGLSDVLKLKPVSFNWNNEGRNISEYKSMGFIAQDVMDVIPNAASTMGDGDMQVDYNAIVATLTKAIQEQQTLIKALEQRILILENK